MNVTFLCARLALLAWPGLSLAAGGLPAPVGSELDPASLPAGSSFALGVVAGLLAVVLGAGLWRYWRRSGRPDMNSTIKAAVGARAAGAPVDWQATMPADHALVEHLEQQLAQRDADLDLRQREHLALLDQMAQLRQTNDRLAQANLQSEAASRAKGEFLAYVSHEIRTPMSAILMLCQLLQREPLPPTQADLVGRIDMAGRKLIDLVNDVLDFSRIEAQRVEIEHLPFRLDDVLDQLVESTSSLLGDKPLTLTIGPAPAGAQHLVGDAMRLGQILLNLTSNAVKFTERGEVRVGIDLLAPGAAPAAAPGRLWLRLWVRDTGVGIAADRLPAIFEAFSQADASTARRFGGSGLGLTISRRLAELMGGRIEVDSQPGHGSEFRLELPFEVDATASTAAPAEQATRVVTPTRPAAAPGRTRRPGRTASLAAVGPGTPMTVTARLPDAQRQQQYLRRFAREYDDVVLRLQTLPHGEALMLLHRLIGTSASLGLNLVTAHARACRAALDAGGERRAAAAVADLAEPWTALHNALKQALGSLPPEPAESNMAPEASAGETPQ